MAGPFDNLPDGGASTATAPSPFSHLPDASPFAHLPETTQTAPPAIPQDQQDLLKQVGTQQTMAKNLANTSYTPPVEQPPVNWQNVEANHPIAGRILAGGEAVAGGIASGEAGLVGLVNPQLAAQTQATIPAQNPSNPALPETSYLQGAGGAIPTLVGAAVNPLVGAGMMGAQGAGQARTDVATARASGADISGGQEALYAGAQGAIQGGLGLALGAVGQKVGGLLKGLTPELQSALASGDATVLQHITAHALSLGGKTVSGEIIGQAVNSASNYIKQGIDPTTALTQGWKENGILSAILPHLPGEGNAGSAGPAKGEEEKTTAEPAKVADNRPGQFPQDIAKQADSAQTNLTNRPLPQTPEHPAGELPKPPTAETTPAPKPAEQVETTGQPKPAVGPGEAAPKHTAEDVAKVAAMSDPDVKAGNPSKFTEKYFAGELKNLDHGGEEFVKADVPIAQLKLNPDYQADKVAEYAKQSVESQPAAIGGIKNGEWVAVDGNTRARAALARGENTIPMMVPKSDAAAVKLYQDTHPQPNNAPVPAKMPPTQNYAPAEASRIKTSWDAVNRFMGTGAEQTPKERDTALNIRTSLGQQDFDRTRSEGLFKPYRDTLDKLSPDAKTQWLNTVEGSGISPDLKLQPAADMHRAINEKNIADGKRYGINTDKYEGDWIGRLAEFPGDNSNGPGSRRTIAGVQNFLKGRSFDTFGDFKNYVEENGGRLKYDNPIDMMLAKDAEVRKSIEARKSMYKEEDRGMLNWQPLEKGSKPPEHQQTPLNDLLARQERPEIAPTKLVGQLAGKQHFDAQDFMKSQDWKDQSRYLRPGDTMPEGYSYTGQKSMGQLYGNDNVTHLFNTMVSGGLTKHVPVWDSIIAAKRASTSVNLGLSAVHGVLESLGNAGLAMGRVMDNVKSGDIDLAVKNAARATPVGGYLYGRKVMEQAANPEAHPELEGVTRASISGGNKFDVASVLNKDGYQKAADAWGEGKPVAALGNTVKAVWENVHDALFKHYIPALRAGAKAAAAETELRRGSLPDEFQRRMGLHQDNIDNMLGSVIRTHQFQNKILTDIEDAVLTAPKFAEGTVRFAGATSRDTVQALTSLAQGKGGKMTPAMYTAIGGLMTQMAGAAITQALYTRVTTGTMQLPSSLQDYFSPKTGRKDENGRDERISVLSPFSFLSSAAKNGIGAVSSRVSPLWSSMYHAGENVDERGVQIRNPNDSGLKQAADTGKYIGKHLLPFSVQNKMESSQPGQSNTADAQVGNVLGMHFAHPASSDAERKVQDILNNPEHFGNQVRTQDQVDRSNTIHKLADDVRKQAPDAQKNISLAIQNGDITSRDRSLIKRRSERASGLAGELQNDELSVKDIMGQVWPVMSDEEKKSSALTLRSRIQRTETLTPAEKQEFLGQLKGEQHATVER